MRREFVKFLREYERAVGPLFADEEWSVFQHPQPGSREAERLLEVLGSSVPPSYAEYLSHFGPSTAQVGKLTLAPATRFLSHPPPPIGRLYFASYHDGHRVLYFERRDGLEGAVEVADDQGRRLGVVADDFPALLAALADVMAIDREPALGRNEAVEALRKTGRFGDGGGWREFWALLLRPGG